MKNLFNIVLMIIISGVFISCEQEDTDASTMCYTLENLSNGTRLSLWCYTDYIHSCEEDGKTSLASYDDSETCFDDTDWVLENFTNTGGQVVPGPNSNGNNNNNNNNGNLPSYCTSTYQGPNQDIQIDAFCMAAWNYLCQANYSPTSQEVKGNCAQYDYMLEITSNYPSCPYCK